MASSSRAPPPDSVRFSCPVLLKKRYGTLEVYDAGLSWTEIADVGQAPPIGTLYVPFDRVRSQAVNATSSDKVMLRLNLAEKLPDGTDGYTFNFPGSLQEAAENRDALKDIVGAALKEAQRKNVNSISQPSNMPTKEDLELRMELLKSDKALAKLHMELVKGEFCSEEDFWELRQDVLANFKLQRDQRRGLAHGASPSDSTAKGAPTKGQKFQLTEEMIQKIFAQNPSVYKSYQENVPGSMTATEFWTRYLKDQVREGGVLGKNMDSLFGSILNPPEDDSAVPKPHLPFLDLEASGVDNVKRDYGYGNRPDPTMVPGADETRMGLLRRLNKYSSMVLDQTSAKSRLSQNRDEVIDKEIVLDDLRVDMSDRPAQFKVPDQSRYFPDAMNGLDSTGLGLILPEDAADFIEQAQKLAPRTEDVKLDPAKSREVIENLTRILDRGDKPGSKNTVPRDVQALHLAVSEVLRHFWGSYPPTSTKQRDKLGRVDKVLRAQLEQMRQQAGNAGFFKHDVEAVENAIRKLEDIMT